VVASNNETDGGHKSIERGGGSDDPSQLLERSWPRGGGGTGSAKSLHAKNKESA